MSVAITAIQMILYWIIDLFVGWFSQDSLTLGLGETFQKTVDAQQPWCVCVGGNSATAVAPSLFLLSPAQAAAMGFTRQAPPTFTSRNISQIDGNRNPIEPSHASSAMFVLTNKSHNSSIEHLLLHHNGTGSWLQPGQTTPHQDRRRLKVQCHTDTAAAWDYNSSHTTANSRPRQTATTPIHFRSHLLRFIVANDCFLTKNCKDKD